MVHNESGSKRHVHITKFNIVYIHIFVYLYMREWERKREREREEREEEREAERERVDTKQSSWQEKSIKFVVRNIQIKMIRDENGDKATDTE